MKTVAALAVVSLALLGCEGPVTDPVQPEPIAVEITSASVTQQMSGEQVQADLRNTGGRGAFKVQAWGTQPNQVNPPPYLYGETETFTVRAGWAEALTFTVQTGTHTSVLRTLVVLARDDNSVQWRETDRLSLQ